MLLLNMDTINMRHSVICYVSLCFVICTGSFMVDGIVLVRQPLRECWLDIYRYPELSKKEIEEKCPFCRNNCNCKLCLRMMRVPEVCFCIFI